MPILLAVIIAFLIAPSADGHPGKTDRYGGHRCLKQCEEWDLYYAEYHLHDKNGKPIRVAAKKKVKRTGTENGLTPEPAPAATALPAPAPMASQPSRGAAPAADEDPCRSSLPWVVVVLLLLWLLVRRRKAEDQG